MKKFNLLLKAFTLCIFLSVFFNCSDEEVTAVIIPDTDADGILDNIDNCPSISNEDQADFDEDGIGDVCDDDDDNDGVLDEIDNCPLMANSDQLDTDNDGIGDVCDSDFGFIAPLFPCENGFADIYPCNDYDLMRHIPIEDLGGTGAEGNDSWGWTDSTTGKEYALVGTTTGSAFVDISNPTEPLLLGTLPTASINSLWRDIKVYNNHAFIVADNAGNHGMQVFDLTRLRNVANPPETFTVDAQYTGFGSAHNIFINEDTGFAYVVGTSTFNGGPHFINIQNPTNPVAAGGYGLSGYSHDAYVVNYIGPDSDYSGRELFFGSNGNEIVIVDVTDKNNPVTISSFTYPQNAFAHQGWFTDDHRYFIIGDEVDELTFGNNTKTIIADFSDLDNPVLSSIYSGPTLGIDHNGYVVGNTYYLANYRAGLRVLDISNIGATTNSMTEIGYFDTFPSSDSANFDGVWNVYPYFESGNIILSDINGGLFIIRKSSN